jgi:hypothetical protein
VGTLCARRVAGLTLTRARVVSMRRGAVLAIAVASLALCLLAIRARADELDPQIDQLAHAESYKVRLAAAIALSKSRDSRAVSALSTALIADDEATIRRVCALGLGKIVDETTPADTRKTALQALDHAARTDRDAKVRDAAAKAYAALSELKSEPSGGGPDVFVNIGAATDVTHKGPPDLEKRLANLVRSVFKHSPYAIDWPGGGTPTHKDLERAGTHAFIVAASVTSLDLTRRGNRMEIGCKVAIRIAPWDGSDGNERWSADKLANAKGEGKADTSTRDADVAEGVRECVFAVAEQVADDKVIPFIKNVATH